LICPIAAWAQTNELRVSVALRDGSRIIGSPAFKALSLTTPYGKIEAKLDMLESLQFTTENDKVNLTLRNGDILSGSLGTHEFEMKTLFGKVRIGTAAITSLTVFIGGVYMEPAVTNGLVLYFPFDGNENGTVRDRSRKKNDGIVNGAKWTSRGKIGGAYEFDGQESCITVSNVEPFNTLTAMTVSAWAYVNKVPSDFAGVVSRRTPGDVWWIGIKSGFGVEVNIGGSKNGKSRTTGFGTIETQKWYHVTFTYQQKQTRKIYIDGQIADSLNIKSSLPRDPSTPVRIGRGFGAAETLDGIIDEVMIFDRALSAEEVKQLYDSQK
jgi:hypothetical protein